MIIHEPSMLSWGLLLVLTFGQTNPRELTSWPTVFNNAFLFGIAFLSAWGVWKTAKNHAETKVQIAEVKTETKAVKDLVNGPLGIALADAASAREQLSSASPGDADRKTLAIVARKASDDHNQIQAAQTASKRTVELEKQKIITEFKAEQKADKP